MHAKRLAIARSSYNTLRSCYTRGVVVDVRGRYLFFVGGIVVIDVLGMQFHLGADR